jgi:hypothetical protein
MRSSFSYCDVELECIKSDGAGRLFHDVLGYIIDLVFYPTARFHWLIASSTMEVQVALAGSLHGAETCLQTSTEI